MREVAFEIGWLSGRALARVWEAGGDLVRLGGPLMGLGSRPKYIRLAFSLEVALLRHPGFVCPLIVPVAQPEAAGPPGW